MSSDVIAKEDCIATSLKKVDRRLFIPHDIDVDPYKDPDSPVPIGEGLNSTALNLGVKMIHLLDLKPTDRVLEVGTGTGFYTALISLCAGEVYSIEIVERLYQLARSTLAQYSNIRLFLGDGSMGVKEGIPYDKAVVWATSPSIPCEIYSQMREGGVIVVPVQYSDGEHFLTRITKDKVPHIERLERVIFTRMRGLCGFME